MMEDKLRIHILPLLRVFCSLVDVLKGTVVEWVPAQSLALLHMSRGCCWQQPFESLCFLERGFRFFLGCRTLV